MIGHSIRLARQHAIERQIKRLDRRKNAVLIYSNRVSWMRAGVFIAGLGAVFALKAQVNAWAAAGMFVVALSLFTLVVLYHRHLERWAETFKIWRDMRADQLARMTLDWACLFKVERLSKKSLALDLDLTGACSLHQLLDTTLSRRASQLLADWLTQNQPILKEIHARQNLVRELVPLTRFRERFQLAFRRVLNEQLPGEDILDWLSVEFPSRRLKWMLPAASALVALNLVLFGASIFNIAPAYWTISLTLYAGFFFFNQASLGTVFNVLVRLDSELDRSNAVFQYLETCSYAGRENLGRLCAPFRDAPHLPSMQMRKIKIVTVGIGLRSNPVLGLVLNLILPWDFGFAYLADRYRTQVAELLPMWMETVYHLDAYIALANFAHLNPEYAFPEIAPDAQPVLTASHLGHPLIPPAQSVRNDFAIQSLGELAIITGSNMAGKSTFIKTIGINLCLAYAGAPVVATHFRALPFRLHSCIRISDSIIDGFSYFYAEVKCLKRLLDQAQADESLPLLYLVDEIFRGTNNRERLLGSRAFIRALLGANAAGLLATHDLELANLADSNPQAHNYHFRDHVAEGKLVFDYKIQPGPCPTTNALKIMQMEGLPVEPGR